MLPSSAGTAEGGENLQKIINLISLHVNLNNKSEIFILLEVTQKLALPLFFFS